MPDWLAATTGLDALTHGIESYVSRAASFLTDGHALAAIGLAREHLPSALEHPTNVVARVGMARASLSAGLAFTNAILGATHAISHQVGGALDLPHGMLNALLLPHVIRFNAAEFPDKFRPIAKTLGVADAGRMPPAELADAIAEQVIGLSSYLGVPQRLRDLDVREEELPRFASTAMRDACMTTNPRAVTEADVLALLKVAY